MAGTGGRSGAEYGGRALPLAGAHRGPEGREGRTCAVEEMQAVGTDTVLPLLAVKLADPDMEVRCRAILALLFADAGRAIDLVLPMLHDPEVTVRWQACGCLHDFGDERAVGPLVAVLADDPDPQVRGTAAYTLGAAAARPRSRPCSRRWTPTTSRTTSGTRPVRARPRPSTISLAPTRHASGGPMRCVKCDRASRTWAGCGVWRRGCFSSGQTAGPDRALHLTRAAPGHRRRSARTLEV